MTSITPPRDRERTSLGGLLTRPEEDRGSKDPDVWVPSSRAELGEWLRHYAGVDIPAGTCDDPGHTAPLTAVWDAYSAQDTRAVWHASRAAGGKTVCLAALSFVEAVTLAAEVTLLGGSFEQSQRVHQYHKGERRSLNGGKVFWNAPNAPTWLLEGDPTKRLTKLTNGGAIEVLTASQKSVRGPHPQRLRGDEIDEMDRAVWEAAQGQTADAGGVRMQTVGSSTWQNPKGTMTEELKLANELGFPVVRWCWRCVLDENGGWVSREAMERKFATISSHMRRVEFDLEEPLVEGTAFDRDAVEAMVRKELGQHLGGIGARVKFEEPVEGATYAAGGDWGKERDRTWIVILRTDVDPVRLVAFVHMGRIPFPQMVAAFNEIVAEYEASACHDMTGIGNVIDDYLEVFSEGVTMVGRRRSELFGNYIVAVERGEVVVPDVAYLRDEHKFCTYGDLYSAGHPPDSVVAMAMAWRAATGLELLY